MDRRRHRDRARSRRRPPTLAAGAGLTAVAALQRGEGAAAFCAVRPPGHHATPTESMGFCLVSNIAVVAAALADAGERVWIFDFDAHHGNGTQAVFYDDPRVLFVSTHQWPLYPGTGRRTETGVGAGAGTTVNIPLPPETTGDVYLRAFDEVIAPVVDRFAPTWLLISAGFDAHRADPLTDLGLSAGDFAALDVARRRARAGRADGGDARGWLRPRGPHRQHGRRARRPRRARARPGRRTGHLAAGPAPTPSSPCANSGSGRVPRDGAQHQRPLAAHGPGGAAHRPARPRSSRSSRRRSASASRGCCAAVRPPGRCASVASSARCRDEPLGHRAVVIDDAHQLDAEDVRTLVERVEDAPAGARLTVAGRFLPEPLHEVAHLLDGQILDTSSLAISADEIVAAVPELAHSVADQVVQAADGCVS